MNQSIYYKDDAQVAELPTMTDDRFELFLSSINNNNDLLMLRNILQKHGIENRDLMKDLYAFNL